jgi:hypothetical protein
MVPNSNLFHLIVTNRHTIPHRKVSPTGQSIESSVESYSQISRQINSPCTCGQPAPLSGCAAMQARSHTRIRRLPLAPRACHPSDEPLLPLTSCGRGWSAVCDCRRGLEGCGEETGRPNSAWASVSLQRSNVNDEGPTSYCVEVGPVLFCFLKSINQTIT